MYTILLVDDEKGIVDGLNILITRSMAECKVIGAAYDGERGFAEAMRLRPDIVVTDIRMLQHDGLDMIGRLKEAGNSAKFILLSGYASFEYAKKGMSLGARFYLNKPVEEEELFECLRQAIREIETERLQSRELDNMRETYANAMEEMGDVLLRDVLDSENEDAWLTAVRLGASGFPMSDTRHACAIVELHEGSETYSGQSPNRLSHWLRERDKAAELRVVPYGSNQLAVVAHGGATHDERTLTQALQRFQREMLHEANTRCTIGSGLIYGDIHGIARSFAEARIALNYRILKGMHTVIAYGEIRERPERAAPVSEGEWTQLDSCLDRLDADGCEAVVRSLLAEATGSGALSLSGLQDLCMSILFCGMRKLSPAQLKSGGWLNGNLLSMDGLARFRTLDELRDWLMSAIRDLIRLRAIGSQAQRKDVIADVRRYIADHYDQNISLADLSNRFYLNPYYLSQLFKEKTGDTYLNYVIKLRIRKSKELLENTDLKIYEVCERVGYSDTNYFSKLFEKLVGCRPSEYKKQANRPSPSARKT